MFKTKMSSIKKQLMFRVSCFFNFFLRFFLLFANLFFYSAFFLVLFCYETFNDQQRNKLITCLAIVFIIFIQFFIFLGKRCFQSKSIKQEVFSNEFFKQGRTASALQAALNSITNMIQKKVTNTISFFLHFNKVFFYFFKSFSFFIKLLKLTDCCFFILFT